MAPAEMAMAMARYLPAQVDYEREAALAGVRTMIHDLEGPADPNPVVLAVKAAFDLNKANVYVNK